MTAQTQSALFDYPARSALGRVVPKSRILTAGKPSRRVREEITNKVAKIVWQHKLAPETLNLEGSPAVPELQVFRVMLKPAGKNEIPVDILTCIDRAISFPIIYELTAPCENDAAGEQICVAATYKRPSEADGKKWVIGDYFSTEWMPADTSRDALPVALDLHKLYEQILLRLIPIRARKGESTASLVERYTQFLATQRECERLEGRMRREKQFNRKVEINRTLREKTAQLENLRS